MGFLNPIGFRKTCKHRHAFTLVEIALALGVFAFAIVAIFSLFPVGLRSASDSRIQSIVTQIARTVLSDLRTSPFNAARITKAPLPFDWTNPSTAPPPEAFAYVDLSLASTSPTYILYTSDGQPYIDPAKKSPSGQSPAVSDINPFMSATKFQNGDVRGDYIVKIEWIIVGTPTAPLTQVTVSVSAPAAAPVNNRTEYSVVTLMGDTR